MTSRKRAKSRVRARNWVRSWNQIQRGDLNVDPGKAQTRLINFLHEQTKNLYRLVKGPLSLTGRSRAKLVYWWRSRAIPKTREAQRRSQRARQLAWSRTTEATGPGVRVMRRKARALGLWASDTTVETKSSIDMTTAVKRTAVRSRARLRGWTRNQEVSEWPVVVRPMVVRLRLLAKYGRQSQATISPE